LTLFELKEGLLIMERVQFWGLSARDAGNSDFSEVNL
jgi:hypothetical protein